MPEFRRCLAILRGWDMFQVLYSEEKIHYICANSPNSRLQNLFSHVHQLGNIMPIREWHFPVSPVMSCGEFEPKICAVRWRKLGQKGECVVAGEILRFSSSANRAKDLEYSAQDHLRFAPRRKYWIISLFNENKAIPGSNSKLISRVVVLKKLSREFGEFPSANSNRRRLSAPYSPKQNGSAERKNWSFQDKISMPAVTSHSLG